MTKVLCLLHVQGEATRVLSQSMNCKGMNKELQNHQSKMHSLCVEKGANHVIVSPFFLFPGRHWHKDVVNDRINHCLSHLAGDAGESDVCANAVFTDQRIYNSLYGSKVMKKSGD
ncbi:hypothetical protein GIB67_030615 [Kingdonia uniflora]|uniref:Uncharacterized protein n=1 Tax=Kingdonia uniflora TaxID=39325 RepID=A0A7J7LM27_9MAGN|nr:hypothetical protein GIB67_030615 [Kingdonia uniflora]